MTTRSSLKQPNTVDYTKLEPLPDPPRKIDMQRHERVMDFHCILTSHFAGRGDLLISGDGFIRRDPDNESECLAPDCLVAFGVEPKAILARNGYVVSEVGKPPDFAMEVASCSAVRRDRIPRYGEYANYQVGEYWRFDHTNGEYFDTALAGAILIDGVYDPVQIICEADGLIWGHSEVLGLDLCWDEGDMRFRDPQTGDFLLTPVELQAATLGAEARTLEVKARVAELEAELRELRGQ